MPESGTPNGWAIVLCAGPLNPTHLPVGTNVSNAMVPINGRPVIGWVLDDLLGKGITNVAVVVREDDPRCGAFLARAYGSRMDLRIAPAGGGSIIDSLELGLASIPEETDGPIRIVLGDTLIRDAYVGDTDFVYVSEVDDAARWCLVTTDEHGVITAYRDKEAGAPEPRVAIAGYYHLHVANALRDSVAQAQAAGERELSDVLRRYGEDHPITTVPVADWFDFRHLEGLADARRRLIRSRWFNTFEVDPILNTITKVGDADILADELGWYAELPEELKVLTPRILETSASDGMLRVVQEYYGYPSLAELYVYGDLADATWLSILRHVMRVHRRLQEHTGTLSREAVASMYADKTFKRLAELREQAPPWLDLLDREEVTLNGRSLRGLPLLEAEIHARADTLADAAPITIIHGDLCFSNILYDIPNQILRLVDPRGSFGKAGVVGDRRYDVAKLRHSARGLYDFIVNDMFVLEETASGFTTTMLTASGTGVVAEALDDLLVADDYDLGDIAFIEGLLFLSMLPLHADHPDRQKMMYLTGLSCLAEAMG